MAVPRSILAGAFIAALALVLPPASADARKLNGTKHADVLRGTKRADVIRGGRGADRLAGRGGSDTLRGGGGRDRLDGGGGGDRLDGGGGGDRLDGGGGPDRLEGGGGRDRLRGGRGRDRLDGGPGADVLDCGRGRDLAVADERDVVRRSCESVVRRGEQDGEADEPSPSPPSSPQPPPSLQGQFDGTLTTTVRYLSVCSGQPLAEQTTQIPSRITIRPPLRPNPNDLPADVPEVNPINLILGQTNVGGTIAPGSINVASAARFRFSAIRSLTLQYWNLTIAGTTIAGTLAEDQREQGAAFNLLAAHQELVACNPQFGTYVNQLAIAEGATLTGTITPGQVQLRIAGQTVDTFHQFVADITATRTG